MKQVRLRLAACRMIPHGEMTSDLPGGEWNISPTRHVRACVSHLFLFYKHIVPIFCSLFFQIQGVIKIFFLLTQQKAGSHVLRAEREVEEEEDVEGEEEEDEGDDQFFTSQHECPLVQQKVNEYPHLPISYNHLFLWPSQPILVQVVQCSCTVCPDVTSKNYYSDMNRSAV